MTSAYQCHEQRWQDFSEEIIYTYRVYTMAANTIQQELKYFAESIDIARNQIATMKSDDVAQELYQVLFADDEKYMHLLKCFQSRATHTIGSCGVSQIQEPMRDTCTYRDEVLHSDKLLDETGAQFIQTIQNTAQECKVDLDQAFANLDSLSTNTKNNAVIDILTVIHALLNK